MPRPSPLASVLAPLLVLAACARPAPEPRSGPQPEPGLPGGAESVRWTVESSSTVAASASVRAEEQDTGRPTSTELITPETGKVSVFLRGGPKTHGPGEHDHPRFVAEWKPQLESRGAFVDSALRFPTAEELARVDVLVLYAAEGASIHGTERADLERFLARGGGLVVLHDAVCGDDPQWFKTVAGGAWEHGHAKYKEGTTDLYFVDTAHPITQGAANFRFEDEIYWQLHMDPAARVLASGFHTVFDVTPQMWTLEKDAYRAFVSIQGHYHESFAHPAWRTLLLRGIAWAGKKDANLLLKPGEAEALAYPKGGPTRPDDAHQALEVHPDFDLSLVAAEPLIEKPISLDWDARGRMWIAETPGYPEKERFSKLPPHDRISILTDANGDGRLDTKKVFFEGLDLATSLVFHRDGVIVSTAPEILWLRDTDGDDVAEKKEVLFSGFGFGDTHAVVSNMRWGLDGWIYATQGYSGGDSRHVKNAAGHDFGHIGNGIFRFRPDGSAIEMVSSYGSNTWGLDFSSDGELFFSMANGAHLRHVVMPESVLAEGRYGNAQSWADIADHDRVKPLLTHEDAPYAQIDFVGGFTAASGCCVYTGGAWPAEWNDAVFVAEPTVHLVHHDVLKPDGVTFKATKAREPEFLAGKDLWFRPVHMRVGPDGALYLLDFYNQAAVHNDTRGPPHGPTNAAIRPDRDHTHGRIWRVQHKQAVQRKPADLAAGSTTDLLIALRDPNSWTRATASRLLVERPSGYAAVDHLCAIRDDRDVTHRIQSAWIIRQRDNEATIGTPLLEGDPDPRGRKHAARIYAARRTEDARSTPSAMLLASLTSSDARERLEAAVAIGDDVPNDSTIAALVSAWPSLDDGSRSVLGRGAAKACHPVISACFRAQSPASLAGLVTFVAKQVGRSKEDADDAYLLHAIGAAGGDSATVEAGLRAFTEAVPSDRRLDPLPELLGAIQRLLEHHDLDVGHAALPIMPLIARTTSLDGSVAALVNRLDAVLDDASADGLDRLGALQALLALPQQRTRALESADMLLALNTSQAVQEGCLQALRRIDDDRVPSIVARRYSGLRESGRETAFAILTARTSWTSSLLDAVASKSIALPDLGPQRMHRLRTHPDAKVAQRAAKLFEELGYKPSAKVSELVERFLPIASQPGDAANGKLVFEKNCVQCHKIDGKGGDIGPDLTGMGTHGAKELLPIVLDPNRAVEAGYAEWQLETKDGKLVTGVMVREDARSVLLRSTNGDVEVARDEIEWIKNTGRSPMPEGLEAIGAEGFRDLFAYMTGGFAGWRVLNLEKVVSSSSHAGLYDAKRDARPMVFRKYGIVDVEGVPFEVLDPRHTESGMNAVVLKGGLAKDWESKLQKPAVVEVPVGFALERVHVLGGIGAWAYPYFKDVRLICTWRWIYADGGMEDVELKSGVEFGDWIGHHDVPGSEYVEDVLAEDSWGQVRRFALEPKRKETVIDRIILMSPDGDQAATFFALTAELAGASKRAAPEPNAVEPLDWLIVGGGTSHDYRAWFERADIATLAGAGVAKARYTERTGEILPQLAELRVLELCNNQPMPGDALRKGIFDFVARGGGLLILHPANWYNWADWPEFNAQLVGGGSRGHGPFGELEVRIVDAAHPLAAGLPATFRIEDELYRFETDPKGSPIHVVATGHSLDGKETFPIIWTVERPAQQGGRTACITLGHDGRAHEHASFQTLLANASRWLLETATPR